MTVAAFYKFQPWADFAAWQERIYGSAQRKGILGTVLIAEEGINGTVCGGHGEVEEFLGDLRSIDGFSDLFAKFSTCEEAPFERLRVRRKREIVTLGVPGIDPNAQTGKYVSPEAWDELVRREDVTVVDVRNVYEIKHGKFEGAIDPHTADFRQFPAWLKAHLPEKDAPVALYCTGGIRCEKATALLLAEGYKAVFHLRGGILNYLANVPAAKSTWKGSCYVFDQRGALDHDLKPCGPNHQAKQRGVS